MWCCITSKCCKVWLWRLHSLLNTHHLLVQWSCYFDHYLRVCPMNRPMNSAYDAYFTVIKTVFIVNCWIFWKLYLFIKLWNFESNFQPNHNITYGATCLETFMLTATCLFYDDWLVHHHILPSLVLAALRRFPIQQAQRTGQKYVGDFDDEDDCDYNDDE